MRLTWAWRQWAFRPGLAVMNVVLLAVGLAGWLLARRRASAWETF